jgi:hypothetical protein
MNLFKSLRNLFNPTSRIDQLISDRSKAMEDNAKTFEALKPVSDRALAKAYELDIQAVPKISEERVLFVSADEMKLAIKADMSTIYGLKLVYEST